MEHKIFRMKFRDVYPCLIEKAEKKNRTKEDVFELTNWLFGYNTMEIENMLNSEITYGEFIDSIPDFNKNANLITGSICGIKVENIEDDRMKKLRLLDKIIDELAKGKSMDKIKRRKE